MGEIYFEQTLRKYSDKLRIDYSGTILVSENAKKVFICFFPSFVDVAAFVFMRCGLFALLTNKHKLQMQIDFSTPELPPPFTRGIVIINVQLLYNTDQIDKNVQLS